MTVQLIDIKKLSLLENNPRKITKKAMEKLCESLTRDPEFLNSRPLLVSESPEGKLTVYAGNQRLRAAELLKWKQIPCIIERGLSENTINQRVISDNKTFGEFDMDILANEWDMSLLLDCGFTMSELSLSSPDLPKDEDVTEDEEEVESSTCPNCGVNL